MITNFEEVTCELTDAEKDILPIIINGLKKYTEKKPIKSSDIVRKFNAKGRAYKLTGVRLRKIVNYIRSNSLLPLIATSNGYYVSYDKEVVFSQIKSLRQRAKSIERCADGLEKFL